MRNVDEAADDIGESKFDALPERVQVALWSIPGSTESVNAPLRERLRELGVV